MKLAPHPFTLRQLQYAVAVAETLSFRKAAECCHVSQPSLSAQLAQMEQAIGVRLFERDKRRVLVTAAGRELVERARVILREIDDLVVLARRSGDPLSGTLHIGVIPTISPYLLPLVTPALRQAFPRLCVCWLEDKSRVLLENLAAGTLDAALLALEAEIGDVAREVIARDPFVLVAPRSHPLAATTADVEIAELRGATVLVLQDEHCLGEQVSAFCSEKSAHVDGFRATSVTTLVQMVAGGAGVTLVPELALPYEVADTHLRVRHFRRPAPGRTIALVWRKRYPLDGTLRHVATVIRHAYPVSRSDREALSAKRSRPPRATERSLPRRRPRGTQPEPGSGTSSSGGGSSSTK